MAAQQDLTLERGKVTITYAGDKTTVKCVIVDEDITVSWSVKSYPSQLKLGVATARAGAVKALADAKAGS